MNVQDKRLAANYKTINKNDCLSVQYFGCSAYVLKVRPKVFGSCRLLRMRQLESAGSDPGRRSARCRVISLGKLCTHKAQVTTQPRTIRWMGNEYRRKLGKKRQVLRYTGHVSRTSGSSLAGSGPQKW
jgi:hypothetical protein